MRWRGTSRVCWAAVTSLRGVHSSACTARFGTEAEFLVSFSRSVCMVAAATRDPPYGGVGHPRVPSEEL